MSAVALAGQMDLARSCAAAHFITDLYGTELPDGTRVALWEKSTKKSTYLSRPDEASGFGDRADVYVGAGLAPPGLSTGARLSAEEALAIPGVWLDIDVNGGPENKTNAAPTRQGALALSRAHRRPTVLINSGYGLQAWWLFEEPWVFENAEEREEAARLTKAWHGLHQDAAKIAGYKIDSTFDLARLMRLPGTSNGKGGLNVPVDHRDRRRR